MEDIQTPVVEPADKVDNSTALAKAGAVFIAAEGSLLGALAEAEGTNEVLASLRSALTTALAVLRAGKPEEAK